jgi:ATP-dependent Clp protease ATP-binding subunit ClpA
MLTRFPMVGRERQVNEVMELLERLDMATAFLVGPAGIGKTRLGTEVLARASSHQGRRQVDRDGRADDTG